MRDAIWEVVNELLTSTEPLNISSVASLWFDITDEVLRALAPDGLTPSTSAGLAMGWLSDLFTEFSSIGFAYNGMPISLIVPDYYQDTILRVRLSQEAFGI